MKLFFLVALFVFLAVITTCHGRIAKRTTLGDFGEPLKRAARSSSKSDSKSKDDDAPNYDWKALGRYAEGAEKRNAIQRAQVMKLYDNVVWPASSYIGAEIIKLNYSVVADYLTENVQGRVSPLGRFDTYFLTGEYFYALAGPLPGASTVGRTRVTTINWTNPITCWNNTCKWRVNVEFKRFSDNSTSNIFTHVGHANFDSTNRICTYEANFIGMERQLNLREPVLAPLAYNVSKTNLCNGIQALCRGVNQQFADFNECFNFMNTREYGGWGKSDQDTWQCRNLHLILARDDPVTHCPHVGPTGGGRCIFNAESTYLADTVDGCRDPVFP